MKTNVAEVLSVAQALDTIKVDHDAAWILVICSGIAPAVKTVGKEDFAPIPSTFTARQSR